MNNTPDSSPINAGQPRQMMDELISRALAYRTGKELGELLEFTRKFPHIAPYNAMLLHVQNPGIRYALRAGDWETKWRRRVRPAARPYVILWTMGPVAFVFDLSDTEPIDPKDDRIPEIVKNPFPAKGQPSPESLPKLMSACALLRIEIESRDYATDQAGQVQRTERGFYEFHIALNSKHTAAQRLGTLAHELGHVFCGHLGETDEGFWPDRRSATLTVRELEAEAVAYIVTTRHNLDIGSAQYLAGYLKDKPLPNYSLDTVLKAAGKVEEMMAGKFHLKRKPPQ